MTDWPRTVRSWFVICAVAATVGSYYLWVLRAAGYRFDYGLQQNGYYNYLARAFARGQTYVSIRPSPELLAAPNPWDPAVDDSLKMQDMALFNGRYYLYHGPGPAVMLFTPWLLITGRDLPERLAMFLFCFGGFAFSCGVLIRWLALAGVKTGPILLALMMLALGVCQSAPYVLSRVWVYEIAIAGGYFCISGALFFLAMGIESRRSAYWLGASGLMFGMAIACRPQLGLAGIVALAGLVIVVGRSRGAIAFATAFTLVGAAVAAYNYQRFGDPFEFGLRYLLAGPNQNRIRLARENILPGLYYWFVCPPDLTPVFPWVRPVFRHIRFPPEYFLEATVGALYLAPFSIAALFIPSGRVRIFLWTTLLSAAGILLFLAGTGFTTQRYEVDFLPMLILVALASFGIHIGRSRGIWSAALRTALVLSIIGGIVVNLALGITGPYNEILRNRPANYERLAGWFSPFEQHRPMLNPSVRIAFQAEIMSHEDELLEPLVSIGRQVYRHFLYAEHAGGKLRLVSRADNSTIAHELAEGVRQGEIQLNYAPESGRLIVTWNGREVIVHDIGMLMAAPSEITIGENRVEPGVSSERFTGRIHGVVKTVTYNSRAAAWADLGNK